MLHPLLADWCCFYNMLAQQQPAAAGSQTGAGNNNKYTSQKDVYRCFACGCNRLHASSWTILCSCPKYKYKRDNNTMAFGRKYKRNGLLLLLFLSGYKLCRNTNLSRGLCDWKVSETGITSRSLYQNGL